MSMTANTLIVTLDQRAVARALARQQLEAFGIAGSGMAWSVEFTVNKETGEFIRATVSIEAP